MTDWQARTAEVAREVGIDPTFFTNQIRQESGFNPQAYNPSGASGIAQIIPRFHPGVDVWDAEASLQYAARLMKGYVEQYGSWKRALIAYNWGSGNLAHWDGNDASLPAETRHYIEVILGSNGQAPPSSTPTYNPDTRLILQNDPWSCWATSARMALEAWGRHPTESWIEPQAIADGIESVELGLLDGSGVAGAAWLTRQYSDPSEGTPTIKAKATPSVSFDVAAASAGKTAILLGGHGWGHWTFVRRYNEVTGLLELGNPAGTWMGIGQEMSREQFNRVGPFSMIAITADGAAPVVTPPPTPAPAPDPCASALTLVGEAYNYDGTVRKTLAGLKQQISDLEAFLERSATKHQGG
jgi:hypothetical protein